MKKFLLLFFLLPCIPWSTLQAAPSTSSGQARPNIVIMLVDDMGWSNIGSYGSCIETPNLDYLAGHGVRFSQFYNAARCCPTRASIMTGLHPHQAGVGHMIIPVRGNDFAFTEADRAHIPPAYQGWLSRDVPTLPEMLKEAGYGTYIAGKWHLASPNQKTWPTQRGFDRFYGHLAGTSHYFDPANLYRDNKHIQPKGDQYYITDAITNEAIGFLKDHRDQDRAKPADSTREPGNQRTREPFFLYLAFNAPHFPMHAMPEDFEKYRGRFVEGWDVLRAKKLARQKATGVVPLNTKLAPRADNIPAWDSLDAKTKDEMDAIMATYAGIVDRIDQNIGKLVEHLRETGELDNTLIFFLTDNGGEGETGALGAFTFEDLGVYGAGLKSNEPGWVTKYGKGWASMSNTPFREYKHFTHQGGVQSPLIVHWPKGLGRGLRSQFIHAPAYLPDLVETCLDVAGATRQKKKNGKAVPAGEGISMTGLLKGETTLHESPFCIEHEGNRVVRHQNWKLVAYYDAPWELFDIENDRSESNNLAAEKPEVVKELVKAYDAFAGRAGVIHWDEAKNFTVYGKKKKKR